MSNNSTEIPYVDPEALAPYWRENTPIWEGDPTKRPTPGGASMPTRSGPQP